MDFIIKKFVNEYLGTETFPVQLYHGTDRNVLEMTESERLKKRTACMNFIAALKDKGVISLENVIQLLKKVKNNDEEAALKMASLISNDSTNYEYRDLYVTQSVYKAKNYAENAFPLGEIGSLSTILFGLFKREYGMDYINSLISSEDIELITELCSPENKPRPVILRYTGPIDAIIERENGVELDFVSEMEENAELCENIKILLDQIYGSMAQASYRLRDGLVFSEVFEETDFEAEKRKSEENTEKVKAAFEKYSNEHAQK
ncbi:MAG: hypothetical protein MSJ26_03420 [Oscillospiraceae bacterium]|nr:hypothetical protein [Oscillospiraceae bacterium]